MIAGGSAATTAGVREMRDGLLVLVEERIVEFLATERTRWARVSPAAATPVEAVLDLVSSGGKRVRPAFCLTGYLAGGGDPQDPRIVAAAAGLELLHTCALLHDDIMDESTHRRGVPTAHTRQTEEHRISGWQGDSRRYGESVAILAGDLALIYADQFMSAVPTRIQRQWAHLRAELVIGQHMDVRAAAESTVDPELSRWIAVTKSGHYTIHRPLAVGAALAGRDDLVDAFATFGVALGQAFQLRDDLIDAFGDAGVSGKPAGLDFEQHKMTLLVALAAQRRHEVHDLVISPEPDLDRLRSLLVTTGIRAEMERLIDDLVGQGLRAVENAPIPRPWRDELAAMARQVAYRDR